MSDLVVVPEDDILLPDSKHFPTLREMAISACNTINLLAENGMELGEPGQNEDRVASELMEDYAKNARKRVTAEDLLNMKPEEIVRTAEIISKFDHAVVKEARQLRRLVVNKLILESENKNAQIRMRALELIGKISEVGLFTDKKELVITNNSPDQVKKKLKDKLVRLRKMVAEDGTTVYEPESPATPEQSNLPVEIEGEVL